MTFEFIHQHTAHCETGVMSSMLRHHGLDISEPMALGLAGGVAFAYLPIVKLNGFPLIAYRMPPKSIITGLRKRLGLKIRFECFSNPEQGMKALDAQLEKNVLVGMQTSVFWLPYFPEDMRFHFNAHNMLVYGKEKDDYLISDPVFESTVRCNSADLQKARFSKGALAPKGLMYYIEHVPQSVDFERIIPQAIRTNVRRMNAPIPIVGIRGIHFLANKLRKLPKQLDDERRIKLFLGHIVRMQEEIGTGGAGFRFIYASFLQESAKILNNDLLLDASDSMTAAGDQWRVFALEAVRMCKRRSELDLRYLSELLHRCADNEANVWAQLKRLKA
ncbi:FIG00655207: hypothetical protein [hydrothermal vent metagenome]|uniref:Peptidase n=1 Tax=hydrothermal vent metagenome TaxID=652676 RepID=A0A3B0ZES8_9ZZZZ